MNAKTLFATPSRARGYTAADMATASADGWRAGQAADNELLNECRTLLYIARVDLIKTNPCVVPDIDDMLATLNERLN